MKDPCVGVECYSIVILKVEVKVRVEFGIESGNHSVRIDIVERRTNVEQGELIEKPTEGCGVVVQGMLVVIDPLSLPTVVILQGPAFEHRHSIGGRRQHRRTSIH